VLLEKGQIKISGSPKQVTEVYLKDMFESMQGASPNSPVDRPVDTTDRRAFCTEDYRDMRADFINASDLRNDIQVFTFNEASAGFGKRGISIVDAVLLDREDHPLSWIVGGEPVRLRVDIAAHKDAYSPIVGFYLKNRYGQNVFGDNTFLSYREKPLLLRVGQEARAVFDFTMPTLEAGDYSFAIAVAEGTQDEHIQHDWKHDALMLKSTHGGCQTGMVGIPMRDISFTLLPEPSATR